jgi:hypothetical protein
VLALAATMTSEGTSITKHGSRLRVTTIKTEGSRSEGGSPPVWDPLLGDGIVTSCPSRQI